MIRSFIKSTKHHFSQQEDKKLRNLVAEYGIHDWISISKNMPGRNQRQCKDRWMKFLSPDINRKPFTKEEDDLIIAEYNKIGPQWVRITALLPGRSDASVKARYKLLTRTRTPRKKKICREMHKELKLEPRANFSSPEETFPALNVDLPMVDENFDDLFGTFEIF